MIRRLLQRLHDLARVERYPFLKRFHARAAGGALLHVTRDSVARGVAIGIFFGILTPVAQILFALPAAVLLRANLVVAAASTLITNPFTLPFVYYFAYRIGFYLTGHRRGLAADIEATQEAAGHAWEVTNWFTTLADWFATIGIPLVLGVVLLATVAALSAFVLVHAAWSVWRAAARWRASRF